jgi:hypothetical protein
MRSEACITFLTYTEKINKAFKQYLNQYELTINESIVTHKTTPKRGDFIDYKADLRVRELSERDFNSLLEMIKEDLKAFDIFWSMDSEDVIAHFMVKEEVFLKQDLIRSLRGIEKFNL